MKLDTNEILALQKKVDDEKNNDFNSADVYCHQFLRSKSAGL